MQVMKYDQCVRSIYRYLAKEDHAVRILNLMLPGEIKHFKQQFGTSAVRHWSVEDYCVKNDLLEMDKLWNDLSIAPTDRPVILYGFTSFLKLQGNEALERFLIDFLNTSRKGKTILVTFQCKYWLDQIKSQKLERLIYSTDGSMAPYPSVTFRSPEMARKSGKEEINSLKNLSGCIEESNADHFTVLTTRKSSDFPNSLLLLKDENNFYDAVTNIDPVLKSISEDMGNDVLWKKLLNDLEKSGKSFQFFIDQIIGTTGNLALSMDHWNTFDNYQRWLYFLALKVFGGNNNWCLKAAVKKADSPENLIKEIYRSILLLEPGNKNYWNQYEIRRKLLNNFDKENHDAQDFVLIVRSYGKNGLYYLSDSSIFEKELIFEILNDYGEEFLPEELDEILGYVYPELQAYLTDYPLNDVLFDSYFRMYRYQKVINKLLPDFEAIVNEQANTHSFIMLPTRAEIIDQQDYDKSEVYFMDAMGTEFLGFLSSKCRDMEMKMKVKLCKAELPSDTSHNKGFVTDLINKGVTVYENDELDHLKHGKNKTYDYSVTKLPTYLMDEFEILATALKQASKRLSANEIQKIYLIPDHGSSRMAMIKSDPQTIVMETCGTHGGRNCAYQPGMPNLDIAIIENDTYALANYDRFKGGHLSGVELHGGASIEEVVIPFITLQMQGIQYEIDLKTPVLFVSYKDKGTIRFSSNVHLDHVQIRLNGKILDATPDGTNTFIVPLTEKLKADTDYTFDILENGNEIESRLSFHVQSKMGTEKDLF